MQKISRSARVLPGELHHITARHHEFQRRHRGRQVSNHLAGSVRARAASPGNRDMRQRSEVCRGIIFAVQIRPQLPTGDAGIRRQPTGRGVHRNHLLHRLQRQHVVLGVRNEIERKIPSAGQRAPSKVVSVLRRSML